MNIDRSIEIVRASQAIARGIHPECRTTVLFSQMQEQNRLLASIAINSLEELKASRRLIASYQRLGGTDG